MRHHNMIDHAEEYRAAAQERRNRGQHTGSMAAGHDWRRQDTKQGSWEQIAYSAKIKFQFTCEDAIRQYRRDCRIEFIVTEDGCIPF